MGIRGAKAALDLAKQTLSTMTAKYDMDCAVEYPETAYELPAVYAWDGREIHQLTTSNRFWRKGVLLASRPSRLWRTLSGRVTMIAAESSRR